MGWTAVRRAIRFAGAAGYQRLAFLLGALSALSTTLLIIDVGLIFDLLLRRDSPVEPSLKRLLEQVLERSVDASPWLASYDSSLLVLLGIFVLLGLLEALLLLLLQRVAEAGGLHVMARLQNAVYQQAARRGTRAARDVPPAKAGVLLTEVCDQVRCRVAARWKVVPRTFVLLPLLLAVGLAVDFFLVLYVLLLLVFAFWVYRLFRLSLERRIAESRTLADRRKEVMRDHVQSALTIAMYNSDPPAKGEFEEAARRYQQPLRLAAMWETTRVPVLVLLISLCTGLLTVVVGLSSDASMTRVVLLMLIFARAFMPARRLLQVWSDAGPAHQAAAEVFAYLDQTPAIGQVGSARNLDRIAASIRVEQVSLGGDMTGCLDRVSLTLPAGSRAAFVSEYPETLLLATDVLLRFCDPDSGRVRLDDVDVREFTLASLRQQLAFASHDGRLLTGTIADNLRCGRSGITQEQMESVAEKCRVLETIQQLPHGFHTTVGPLGRSLRPDVAFRIGLARALIGEPTLIVIDEPPEPHDEDARHQLDQATAAAVAERTTVVLARRLSTLRSASCVYVFHEGRLHAHGEHAELLKQDALYRHLNYLWFNPFARKDHDATKAE